jgi:hypothetical protein
MELVIEVSGAAATARAYGLLLGPCVPTVPAIRMHARTHACMHRTACTHAPHACTHAPHACTHRPSILLFSFVVSSD